MENECSGEVIGLHAWSGGNETGSVRVGLDNWKHFTDKCGLRIVACAIFFASLFMSPLEKCSFPYCC